MIFNKNELLHQESLNLKENLLTKNDLKEIFEKISTEIINEWKTLCYIQAKETGKPIKYCRKELFRCLALLDYGKEYFFRDEIKDISYMNFSGQYYTQRVGTGAVLAINTFSSPYSSFIHKMIGVLLGGCTFYFKPSPRAEKCSLELYKLIDKVIGQYNKKIVNFLVDIKDYEMAQLLESKKFSAVLFTGKSETASEIKKRIGRTPGIFETGSSAMAYVHTKDNLERIAKELISASFSQSGMRCIGLKNLFINVDCVQEILPYLVSETNKLKCGEAVDWKNDVGPIFDDKMRNEVLKIVERSCKEGFELISGGEVLNGNILQPTILYEKRVNQKTTTKEVYAPVLFVHTVTNFEEIPEVYFKRSSLNNTIYSSDKNEEEKYIKYNIYSGSILVDTPPDLRIDKLPFGGVYDENERKEDIDSIINVVSRKQIIIKRRTNYEEKLPIYEC